MTTQSNNCDEEQQGQEGPQPCECTDCRTAISSNGESGPVHSYFVRWNGLSKRVNVKVDSGGLLKKSIAADVKTRNSTLKSNSNKKRTILNQVSGWAAPGKLLALIGPSGSGKTSLLNALSGRTSIDEGNISVNGKPLTPATSHHASDSHSSMKRFMSQVAYVRQEDIFFTHLTTRDQLAYTAFLKLPPTWTRVEKLAKVDETIHALRLSKVQNSPIKLLSGGEQKRVNIGTELLTNPSCLLLDEPTSGLDSTSAVALVKLLQRLARNEQKTVIMSIHQPSSGMFLSFDNLLLLADGYVVYHGTPRGSIQYLKDRGLACPEGYNIADHWMDLLVSGSSLEDDDHEDCTTLTRSLTSNKIVGSVPMASSREQVSSEIMPSQERTARPTTKEQLIEIWDAATMSEHMESEDFATEISPDLLLPVQKYSASWGTQYCVLVHRALKNSRSAIFTPLNMIKSVLLGIMSGMMWFQLDYTEETVRDRSAYFFFSMTYWVFDSMYGAVLAFPSERKVILKERASASYHLSAYFMAKTTSEAPTRLTMPLLYVTISFWMGGMSSTFSLFVYTTLISLLSVLAGESYGLLIGASVDEMDRALTTTTLVSLLMMIVGGFYVENVPSFLGWIKYISPFKYSFDACRSIVFNEPVPCDGSGALQDLCNNGQEFVSPDDLKTFLEINGTLAFNVSMLIVLGLVPRLFAYFVLKFRKSSVR